MATQETYLTSFVEGIQTIAERFIQIGQFDKTVNAKIVDHDNVDQMLYYVSVTGCSRLPVRKSAEDATIYLINDNVYVNIPNGDFSSPDKLIIGKVNSYSYSFKFKEPKDYLLEPLIISNFPQNNDNCYSTLIIEFTPIFKDNIEEALGVIKTGFSYTISFKDSNNIDQSIKGIWTTDNLYGAIFNKFIPNKQYIVITGLENYHNIEFTWDEVIDAYPVEVVTYGGKIIGNTTLSFADLKYYIGYAYDDLEEKATYNTVIKLTANGYIIFKKIVTIEEELLYENRDNENWELPNIIIKDTDFKPYWVQLNLNYSIDALNRLDRYKNYLWKIEWFEKDLSLLEDEKVSYVPDGWRQIEKPQIYNNKLVCLKAISKDTSLISNSNTYLKILYSAYE